MTEKQNKRFLFRVNFHTTQAKNPLNLLSAFLLPKKLFGEIFLGRHRFQAKPTVFFTKLERRDTFVLQQ